MSLFGDVTVAKTGTGTGTLDIPVSTGDLAPRVCWIVHIGRTDIAAASGARSLSHSYGIATGASEQGCAGGQIQGAAATSNTAKFYSNAAVLQHLPAGSSTISGVAVLDSFSANNVRLNITQAFPSDYTIGVAVLAGSDINQAKVINVAKTSTTNGGFDDFDFGFIPQFSEIISSAAIGAAASTTYAFSRGVSCVPDGAYHTCSQISVNAQAASASGSYHYGSEFLSLPGSASTVGVRATLSSISNGIRLTYTENDAFARLFTILGMSGNFRCKVGSVSTALSLSDVPFTTGFPVVLGSLASANKAQSTQDTLNANAEFSLGFWTGQSGSKQISSGFIDPNNADVTTTATWIAPVFGDALLYQNLSAAAAVEGAAGIAATTSTTEATLRMSVADAVAAFASFTAFGEGPQSGRFRIGGGLSRGMRIGR